MEADMRIRPTLARVAAAGALTGAVGLGALAAAAPAGASPGQTGHGISIPLPIAGLQPFVGPPVPIPTNCGFDTNAVFTVTGNGVFHGSENKNGSWGGETITGAAELTDPTYDGFTPFDGQATGWGGGGTNVAGDDSTGQLEGGQTFHFHGTNAAGQSLTVQFDWHLTVNNNGQLTATKVIFTCS
jgi:hypothetical protein